MDRLACVDIPSFPLQILVRRNPTWSNLPVALVSRESLQGEVLAVNAKARSSGVSPGVRYAEALSLEPLLRVGEVSAGEMAEAVSIIAAELIRFSDKIEPLAPSPGTFYLSSAGLRRLFKSPKRWADNINEALAQKGFLGSAVVGFTRFGARALAREAPGTVRVVRDPNEERAAVLKVHLAGLGLSLSNLSALSKLGASTIGDLLRLPKAGLMERFGPEVEKLHREAACAFNHPLNPFVPEEPVCERLNLDEPESDAFRLTFLVKQMLTKLLSKAASLHQMVSELTLDLRLDGNRDNPPKSRREILKPARPTLDEVQLTDLFRLRFEALQQGQSIDLGIVSMTLTAQCSPASKEQLRLFFDLPRRDPGAADRALARLRAELGSNAVVRARLLDNHLPEARFVFEPLEHVRPLQSSPGQKPSPQRCLIRRIYLPPRPLARRPVCGPRGAHLAGMDEEPAPDLAGPYKISGGWWIREVSREYYFVTTQSGRVLWVYFDRNRRRWFLQGEVE